MRVWLCGTNVRNTNLVAEGFHVGFRELFALTKLRNPAVDFVLHPLSVRCVFGERNLFLRARRDGSTRSKIGKIGISASALRAAP